MKLISLASRRACFATVLAFLLGSTYPALAGKGNSLVFDVKADPDSLSFVENSEPGFEGEGPFHILGDIFKLGTDRVIGEFHCWGYRFDSGDRAATSQEYNLFGRGKIEVQGVVNQGLSTITGGTGRFRNVGGEATGADPCAVTDSTVTVRFRLIRAGRGKKEK